MYVEETWYSKFFSHVTDRSGKEKEIKLGLSRTMKLLIPHTLMGEHFEKYHPLRIPGSRDAL